MTMVAVQLPVCEPHGKNRVQGVEQRPRLTLKMSGSITAVAFAPQLRLVIAGDAQKQLFAWDTTTGTRAWKVVCRDEVRSVTYAHSLRTVVAGDEAFVLTVVDPISGVERRELQCDSMVMSVLHAPELSAMISGGNNGDVVVWDAATWTKRFAFQCDEHLLSMDYAAELRAVITADGMHCKVSVWDAESGAKLQELLCDSWALSVAYVPGIKAVICGEEAHKLTVWDLESGSAKWDVELSGPVNVVSYLADAAAVVANNADVITIRDVETGVPRAALPSIHANASRDGLIALAHHASASEIVCGDFFGAVSIWPVGRL